MTLANPDSRLSVNALWWRIPAWGAITGATAVAPHGLGARVAAGALVGTAALAIQFTRNPRSEVRLATVLYATVAGLAACFVAHEGLGEIAVVVAASRAPEAMDGRWLRAFVVSDTVAFAFTVGFISRSLAGALAGTAIPVVVQRSLEHRDLQRARDRAQALLVEAQNGREAEAQAAALRERGRIAREMHDVLAHSLAGLSVQLQGVRAVAAREGVSDAVLVPLDKAATLAREGLAEARATVGALRDPGGLGLDALAALVARHPGKAGLTASGTPGEIGAEAGHAVYRAVQESLTNAARYAPGSAVRVELDWRDRLLEVTISDDGPALGRGGVAGQGSGLGLAGMGERLTSVGASLQAGPDGYGGWQVRLGVPVGGAVREVSS